MPRMNLSVLKFWIVASLMLFGAKALGQSTHGVLMVVKGKVEVTSGKTKKTSQAKVGDKVYQEDKISTGPDSRAKIVMTDKNVIHISPDSEVSIDTYINDPSSGKKKVNLSLLKGKIRNSVKQKYDGETNTFNVKTPTAVAGVRGTDFLTSFDPQTNSSKIVTFHGRVEAGTPGPGGRIMNSVMVDKGKTTQINNGQRPQPPQAVPEQELVALNQETDAGSSSNSGLEGDESRVPTSESEKDEASEGNEEPNQEQKPEARNEEQKESKEASVDEPKPTEDATNNSETKPKARGTASSKEASSQPKMVNSDDTSVKIGAGIKAPGAIKPPALAQPIPTTPIDRLPANNDFIREQIRNATSNVKIQIEGPN